MSHSCLGYADDVLLFSKSKAALEAMIEDCCVKFGEAGLEVGLDKTHWSSSIAMDGETLAVRDQNIVWERKLEFIGSRDRAWCTQWWSGETPFPKGVLGLLQVETSPVQPEPVVEGESESVRGKHSLECHVVEWLAGLCRSSKNRCARLLSQMVAFKQNPHDDFATFWRKLHRRGHELAEVFAVSPFDMHLRAKHRLVGHVARFVFDNPVYQLLESRNLACWREEQRVWGKTKFGGAHPRRF